ncbi:MAG: FIG007959: peptidase, M16 family [uncultured Corynebacteriales bacterium]|uniref:FIG007959: peptidase, M16 family n=1 Tax=uncultured Mycobacteriales bacterium TaxID=581187 RepID=A0A6J4HZY4_9ACTN|nr:MAG: FIG007959: peptidase, M16 family [uncultured Corynebacteriales bacterium]
MTAVRRAGRTQVLGTGSGGEVIRRTVLPGGLRVVTEQVPGARSAAVGIWVGVGARDETPALSGASHFLEHLLFKGTTTRSALDIAVAVDNVGGDLNAFTSREHTCYYAHVLGEDLPMAVDLVCDVVTDAVIAPPDVESERGVILEEIAMRDDDPSDLVGDLFGEALFGPTPLGRPVIGDIATIETLRRDQIAGYWKRRYTPDTMVVAVAGAVDHAEVVRRVRASFGARLDSDAVPRPPRAGGRPGRTPARRISVTDRPTEQANLVLGSSGLARTDDRRYALGVLNNALGGGMSSRLFQEIREKRGLAYSVYSFAAQYAGAGQFGVSVGCHPAKVPEVLSLVREQLAEVAEHGVSDAEVARGQGQSRGGLVLGLEDNSTRMSRIGKGELAYGEVLTVDDVLARIAAVTPEDCREVAADVLRRPLCLAVVGPFAESDFTGVLD